MKPTLSHTLSVGFVSLGCAKNRVDTQIMAGRLIKEGLRLAEAPESADVIVVNTCAFIDEARQETIDTIQSLCQLKAQDKTRGIFVAGCYSQRYPQKLRAEFPLVDGFIGLDALDRIGDLVRRWQEGEQNLFDVPAEVRRLYDPELEGLRFAGGPYAFLKISEGCHHRCRFCAIPHIRGRYRSRPVARLVEEAKSLVNNGVRELNLISQDSLAYGRDLAGTDKSRVTLPTLLQALDALDGRFWIRVLYGHVGEINKAILDAMRHSARICRYLDLPIQHSHPAVLRAMGRGAGAARLPRTFEKIRAAMPDIALRTTCLVGYPGETEARFEHLLRFVKEVEFDHLGVFVFSPEAGTPASRLCGRPAPQKAEERREKLLDIQNHIVGRKAASLVGARDRILLERQSQHHPDLWAGRSYRQAPETDGVTWVDNVKAGLQSGDGIEVRYTGWEGCDMVAEFSPVQPQPNHSLNP